ncbi:Hypothetical predicted protein, partial [Paramuricea clavata]
LDDVAAGVNTRVSTPLTPAADEQLVPNSDEVTVQCSCSFNGDDGMMILCDVCKNWQHASCYRFFTEEDCPLSHICLPCAKNENKECTDSTLVGLNPITLQTTCLWRRALVACRKTARLTAPKFAERLGVELTVAQGLMKRMQNEGFLRQAAKGKRLGKLVTKEKFTIESLMKYFYPIEDTIEKAGSAVQQNENKKSENDKKEFLEEKELQQIVNKAAEIDISGKYRAGEGKEKDLEFSVSDSQDPMDCCDRNPAKKRKASAAEKAIVI